ncbi:MAG: IS1380 family transposase [Thermoanaerobaculia bacterium]
MKELNEPKERDRTMRGKLSKKLRRALKLAYTSKALSGWGGLLPMQLFMEALKVREVFRLGLPDGRTSNNKVDVVDYAIQFLTSVLLGGAKFEHIERIRADEVVRELMQIKRSGSASSITRYFGNFTQGQSEHLHVVMSDLIFKHARRLEKGDIVDLDSTVFTRYGDQQGRSKGYNPHARGERSRHPLLAMAAKTKLILHAWLREGSASPHRGSIEFLQELLSRLPEGFRIQGLRADSGFYSRAFMDLLEERGIPYAIAAKMSQGFTSWCQSRTNWQRIDDRTEVAEGFYKSPKTDTTRRIIVVRYTIRRQSEGMLFEVVDYEFRAIATSIPDDASSVYRFYQKRGDCENRIKELKYDFNADKYCLNSFAGTEAAFRLICFLFNLVALFKSAVLKDTKITLGTIRTKIFVIGASIGRSARRSILRLGLSQPWTERFDKLLEAVDAFELSTAAQLNESDANPVFEPPSPWSYRRTPGLRFVPY